MVVFPCMWILSKTQLRLKAQCRKKSCLMMSGRFFLCPEERLKRPGQETGQFLAQHGFWVMGVLCETHFVQLKKKIADFLGGKTR